MELQYKIVKTDFNEINAIHSIVFDYVTKEGKIFERKQLNISEAYSNLEDVFSIINDDLDTFFKNNNLSILDWSRRKDILLKFVEE
jgi:hypothetical protein